MLSITFLTLALVPSAAEALNPHDGNFFHTAVTKFGRAVALARRSAAQQPQRTKTVELPVALPPQPVLQPLLAADPRCFFEDKLHGDASFKEMRMEIFSTAFWSSNITTNPATLSALVVHSIPSWLDSDVRDVHATFGYPLGIQHPMVLPAAWLHMSQPTAFVGSTTRQDALQRSRCQGRCSAPQQHQRAQECFSGPLEPQAKPQHACPPMDSIGSHQHLSQHSSRSSSATAAASLSTALRPATWVASAMAQGLCWSVAAATALVPTASRPRAFAPRTSLLVGALLAETSAPQALAAPQGTPRRDASGGSTSDDEDGEEDEGSDVGESGSSTRDRTARQRKQREEKNFYALYLPNLPRSRGRPSQQGGMGIFSTWLLCSVHGATNASPPWPLRQQPPETQPCRLKARRLQRLVHSLTKRRKLPLRSTAPAAARGS